MKHRQVVRNDLLALFGEFFPDKPRDPGRVQAQKAAERAQGGDVFEKRPGAQRLVGDSQAGMAGKPVGRIGQDQGARGEPVPKQGQGLGGQGHEQVDALRRGEDLPAVHADGVGVVPAADAGEVVLGDDDGVAGPDQGPGQEFADGHEPLAGFAADDDVAGCFAHAHTLLCAKRRPPPTGAGGRKVGADRQGPHRVPESRGDGSRRQPVRRAPLSSKNTLVFF